MDFLTLFIEEFVKVWDGAVIGIIAAMVFLIMSNKKYSLNVRVFLAFSMLLILTLTYASFLTLQKYY